MKQIYLIANVCLGLSGAFATDAQTYDSPNEVAEFLMDYDYQFKETAQNKQLCDLPSSMKEPQGNAVYDSLKDILKDPDQIEEFYLKAEDYVTQWKIGEDPEFEHIRQMVDVCCLVLRAPIYKFDVEDISRNSKTTDDLDLLVKDVCANHLHMIIRHIAKNERIADYRKLVENISQQLIAYIPVLRQNYHQEDNIEQSFGGKWDPNHAVYQDVPPKLVRKYVPAKYFIHADIVGSELGRWRCYIANHYRNNLRAHERRTLALGNALAQGAFPPLGASLLMLYPKDAKTILNVFRRMGYKTDLEIADCLYRAVGYYDNTEFLYKGRILREYHTKSRHIDREFGCERL